MLLNINTTETLRSISVQLKAIYIYFLVQFFGIDSKLELRNENAILLFSGVIWLRVVLILKRHFVINYSYKLHKLSACYSSISVLLNIAFEGHLIVV